MGRLSAASIALVLGAVAALGLVACGGGNDADLLPGGTASEINANLDQVEQLANEGDCGGAAEAAQAVSSQVETLGGVDAKLKEALREGAVRLNEVVAGCEETTTEEETVPSIAPAEEPEEDEEKPAKPAKPKQEEKEEKKEPEETTTPTLPPQAEGEAKGHEKQEEEVPSAEPEAGAPSGGVGPGEPAEGEG
jgi:outer membrane biosynthesis protein TonB